ncbi:hypothetical protein [Prochlorococcus marinus]|uniref:Uncharacterized protein n=1 Tax=Prochlorococcus marinus (strain MIT 9211) TaxID=93059 RepID=A9BE07_PROM4|nr:hypothetical protein [Prochlorococcus marinus]ABX08317.1 Hypothetical protein P9211_03861 [Prochlorococcus marinus str. MIT 9211]
MMNDNRNGPFKKKLHNDKRPLRDNGSWTGIAIVIIAIAQLPIALKASLEILSISNLYPYPETGQDLCKK